VHYQSHKPLVKILYKNNMNLFLLKQGKTNNLFISLGFRTCENQTQTCFKIQRTLCYCRRVYHKYFQTLHGSQVLVHFTIIKFTLFSSKKTLPLVYSFVSLHTRQTKHLVVENSIGDCRL